MHTITKAYAPPTADQMELIGKLRAVVENYQPMVSFLALVNVLAREIVNCTPSEKDAIAAATDMGDHILRGVTENWQKNGAEYRGENEPAKTLCHVVSKEAFGKLWDGEGDIEIPEHLLTGVPGTD
jgi:hypothetical protein